MVGHLNSDETLDFAKFPVYFRVSREFGAETGPIRTAASASQCGLGSSKESLSDHAARLLALVLRGDLLSVAYCARARVFFS